MENGKLNNKIDFKKLSKFSRHAPRYTSYPTAVEFKDLEEKDIIPFCKIQTSLLVSIFIFLFVRALVIFVDVMLFILLRLIKEKDILII